VTLDEVEEEFERLIKETEKLPVTIETNAFMISLRLSLVVTDLERRIQKLEGKPNAKAFPHILPH
jgi:hypothetical protein